MIVKGELLIPCFDDFYGVAIDCIDFEKDNPKVLDLGAGTGILSQFLLEKYPNAEIVLIDLAEEMLKEAEKDLRAMTIFHLYVIII